MSSHEPYPAPHAPYPGYPAAPPYPGYPAPPIGPRNGLGTWALVLAVLALLFSWSIIGGVIGGLIAVVLGFAGRGRAGRGEADNGAIANAGIGLGALAVVVGVAFIPIWIGLLSEAGIGDLVSCMEKAGSDRAAQVQCENSFRDGIEKNYGV